MFSAKHTNEREAATCRNVLIDKRRGLWYNKYYFSENKNSFAHRRHGFINERLVKNNERN